jgi:hypothetical protein
VGRHQWQQPVSGQLGCNVGLVEGEVGSNIKVQLGEEERSYDVKRLYTKLRRSRRLNLLVDHFFLFICVGQYKIVKVEITILE